MSHSSVIYDNKMYIFGGVIKKIKMKVDRIERVRYLSNNIHLFDLKKKKWEYIDQKQKPDGISDHCAVGIN